MFIKILLLIATFQVIFGQKIQTTETENEIKLTTPIFEISNSTVPSLIPLQNVTNSSHSVEDWLKHFESDKKLTSDCKLCMNLTDCNYYCSACSIKFKTNNCRKYSMFTLASVYIVILLVGISSVFLMVAIVCAFKARGIRNKNYERQKDDSLPTYSEASEKRA